VTFHVEQVHARDKQNVGVTGTDISSAPVYHSIIHNDGEELIVQELSRTSAQQRTKDVRLFTGGRYVACHRWLLSASSPLLRRLMYEADPYQSKEHLDFCLPDFSYKEISALVGFLYKGQATVQRKGGAKIRSLLWLLQMELSIDMERQVGSSLNDKQNDIEKCETNSLISRVNISVRAEGKEEKQTEVPNKQLIGLSKKTFYIGKGMRADQLLLKGKNHCLYCEKNFKSSYSLKKHMKVHNDPYGFMCSYCQKVFACKETLVNHTRTHTGEFFVCEIPGCCKRFSTLRSFKDHENVHSGKESFLCHFCGENFPTKKKLFNHKEKHKTTSDPCNICGKEIKNLASYKAHMKAHNQGKSFGCNICGRAFKRRFDLTVHTRIHTGDKPYSCDVCGKSFSLTSTLSKHKKFHVNTSSLAAVYPCNICEDKFSSSADLAVHRRDTHQSEFLIVDEDGNLLSGVQDNTHQVTIVSGVGEGDVIDEGDVRVQGGQLVAVNTDGRVVSNISTANREGVHLRIPNNL